MVLKKYLLKKLKTATTIVFSCFLTHDVMSQAAIGNYTFTTNNNGSLAVDANSNTVDMTTGTVDLLGPSINSGSSEFVTLSNFSFSFMGTRFTQFSVNNYGVIQLGTGAIASNTFLPVNANTLSAFSPSSAGGNAASMGTSSTGKIHYKVVGTFPNRCLVIEFLNMRLSQSSTTTSASNLCTWQVRLYEGNGMIEYMYGNMFIDNITNLGNFTAGIVSTSTVHQLINLNTHTAVVNTPNPVTQTVNYTSTGNITSLHSTSNPNRRFYRFTPSAPAAPTGLSFSSVTGDAMILSWTDNATNEVGYDVLASNDGGVTYVLLASLGANVSTYSALNLQAGTTYDWAIMVRKEGYGTTLTGSQATSGASTITATTIGGNWSTPSTWVGGVVPGINNNVIIPNGSTVTIDATNLYCRNLTVGGGTSGTLQYSDAVTASLFVVGNVTVSAGASFTAGSGTITNHALVIGGLYTNQITNGNLTVNGNFDMNTSAAVATTFAGNLDATISGSGTIDFFSITVNKGNGGFHYTLNPTLICNSVITIAAATGSVNRLILTSGTFRLNSASTLNAYAGSQTICSSAGRLWINNAGATIRQNGAGTTANAGSPFISGELRIDNGTFEYGSGNNTMTVSGTLRMNGGVLNMYGAISFTSSASVQFLFSNGTINVDANIPSANQISTGTNIFTINSLTTVIWSGGTINIINPHSAAGGTAWNALSGGNKVITGGNLNIGNGVSTVSGGIFGTTVGFGLISTMPVWNLTINNLATSTTTRQARLLGTVVVTNNFTVSTNGVLAMGQSLNSQTLQIGGNATISGNINGNEIGSSFVAGTLYFLGNTAQTLSIPGTITNLQGIQLRNPAGLTLANNLTVSRAILETGVLNNSGATLTIGRATAGDVPTITIGSGLNTLPAGSFSAVPTFVITAGNYRYIYNQTSNALTQGSYNEVPTGSSISVRQFTINNTNGITLTKTVIADTTQMTAGNITLGANDYQFGTSATTPGSFTYNTATGGFLVTNGTGRVIRWMGTSGLPTSAIIGSIGHFPIGSGTNNRNVFIFFNTATALTTGGTFAVRYVEASGSTTITSYNDGTLTGVDTRSNSNWVITTPTTPTLGGGNTISLRIQGSNVIHTTNSFANVTLSTATGIATGTYSAGTGTTTTDPIANRIGISSIANLTANPYYMAAPNVNFTLAKEVIFSAASGNWSNTATWQGGVVPTSNEDVVIRSEHNVILDATGAAFNLTIQNGGSLTVNANTLTCGPTGGGYVLFDNYGTLNIGGGTININGNLIINNGSNFIMSDGNLNIDGNNGTVPGSVSSSYDLFSIGRSFPASVTYSTGNVLVTGGTITIVDPPINGSTNYAFAYRAASGIHNNWSGNTLQLGGSSGTHKSGHVNGFMVGTYISLGRLQLGNVIVNGGNLNNATLGGRFVSTPTSSFFGFDCINLTVNSNSEIRQPTTGSESVHVAGVLINNGLITIQTTSTAEGLRLGMLSGTSEVASIYNQSVSGTGEWRNVLPATPSSFTGGTNYQVGDVITVTNGSYSSPVRFSVTTVNTTGGITGFTVSDPGSGYTVLPTSPFTISGGSGSGASITALTTTNIPPTASVSSLIVNNASSTVGSGVSPISWGINNFFIGNNLTFSAGIVNIGSNTITLGTQDPITFTRTQMGNISYTAGGFQMTTGAVRRVYSGTLPTVQGNTNVGHFPIVQGTNARNLWIWFSSATAPTTAGIISVSYNNATGLSNISTPFTEGSVTYNRRTNATWNITIPNAIAWATTPTINMRIAGTGLISPLSVAPLNLINNASGGTAAPGTYTSGTGTETAPQANRNAIPYASLANTYTFGAASDNLAIEAIANGNWGDPATWSTGTVPTSSDNVIIPSPFTVTLAGGTPPYACNNLTINIGGTLIANANTLNIGPTGGGNRFFNMAGKLDLNGATINVNGRIDMPSAATTIFTFTSGNINVDGNDGTSGGSVGSGITLFNVGTSITSNVVGGNITIVDPPFTGTANSLTVGSSFIWPNVNLTIGDGISTNPSTNTNGFIINTSSTRFGAITINGGSAASRWATINSTTYTTANLTVNAGSQLRITGTCGVAGNVVNNGTLITQGTLQFSLSGSVVTSGGQSASGSGVYRNNLPTAFLSSAGTGYSVGDVLTLTGLGGTPIQITVLTVGGGGAITSFYVSNIGAVTSLGTPPFATTGGTGSGAEFTLSSGASGAIPFALFTNLTVSNNTAAGVNLTAISGSVDPATAMSTVSGTLNIGPSLIELGSNNFVIGFRDNNVSPPAFASGSTSFTQGLGRIKTTGTYSRFYSSTGSAPISTAQHIFILGTATDARYAAIYFGATTSIASSGFISISHSPSNILNSPTPFSDCSGLFTINRVTAASWTFSMGGGLTLGTGAIDTANMVLYPYGIMKPVIASDIFVTQATSAAPGNCAAGTGTTAQPQAVRTGLNTTQFNSTYYVGADAANLSLITTIASGNWSDPSIWDAMAVPTSSDNVRIADGHTVDLDVNANAISLNVVTGGTLNASANTLSLSANLTLGGNVNISGATLNITGSSAGNGISILNNGDLNISSGTVNLGPTGGGNRTLSMVTGGNLNISGGVLNVNGNVSFTGGSFTMSSGDFNIDGNSGSSATSVNANTTSIFNITTTLGGTVNGGTITIVDPHFDIGATTTPTYAFNSNAATMNWAGNTLNFGDGSSIQSSSKINGFGVNMISNHQLGNVNIRGGATSRRFVAIGSGASGNLNCVNLTIFSGSELRTFSDESTTTSLNVSGNLTNNGTLRISGLLAFRRATSELATSAQTFSGSGTFESNSSRVSTINSGGTGYTVGDILTLVGGTSTTAAQFVVTSTSSGVITGLSPYILGSYTVEPSYPASLSGGTGSGATITVSNLISNGSIGNLTFLNGNTSGITWNINNLTIRGTLTFSTTTGVLNIVDLGTNTLRLGTSNSFPGTLTYSAGGFKTSTGKFGRWFTTTTAPISVTSTGQFPFVNATGASQRHAYVFFNSASALTTAGIIDVNYVDGSGLATITPFNDLTFTVNRISNATWAYSAGTTLPVLGGGNSITLAVRGDGISSIINTIADIRLTQSTGALGTHVNGTGTVANPTAQRNYTTLSEIFTTHVFSGNAANFNTITSVNSIANGNWGDPTIWSTSTVPNEFNNVTINHQVLTSGGTPPYNCNQIIISSTGELIVGSHSLNVTSTTSINSGGNLLIDGGAYTSGTGSITGGFRIASGTATFNGASGTGLTINSSGRFNQWGGTLNVGVGINNAQLNFASGSGDTISGGNINVNGNLAIAGTYFQSGGLVSVDGNSGTAATSVVAATRMVQFTSPVANINCNGGTIRIVDPHHSSISPSSTTKTLVISTSVSTTAFSGTHTFEFGDGSSTTPGNSDGFVIETFQSGRVPIQNVTVNAGNVSGRWVSTTNHTSIYGTHIKGTLTINSGSEFRHTNTSSPEFNIGGNIVNNGTLTISQPFTFGNSTFLGTLSAQTVSGSGTFRNAVSSPTGSFVNTTIDNSSGVTFSNNQTITGVLAFTNGILNIGNTTLTLNGSVSGMAATRAIGSGGSGNIHIGGSGTFGTIFFDQTTPGTTNRFANLVYNRASITITLGNQLQITGVVTPTAGTLATGGFLTLVSNASGTAKIEQGSGSYLTGNVTVERYVPASGGRRWRYLAAPFTTGPTFATSWQQQIHITGAGTGGTVCPTLTPHTNGFDASTFNNPSIVVFNESIATGPSFTDGWQSIPNTNATSLTAGVGYNVWSRGDRSIGCSLLDGTNPAHSPVTLSGTGTVTTGNFSSFTVTYNASNGEGWNLVGNPYPSNINWDNSGWTKTNIDNTYYIFNPITASFASWNGTTGVNSGGPIIPSGMSFFVKANASSPSLAVTESVKTSTEPGTLLLKRKIDGMITLSIKGSGTVMDEHKIVLNSQFNDSYESNFDAEKLMNPNLLNLYSWFNTGTKNTNLCINGLAPVDPGLSKVINLGLQVPTAGNYPLNINIEDLPNYYEVYLVDKFLNSNTLITGNYNAQVTVTSDSTSQGKDRFQLVFKNTLPPTTSINTAESKSLKVNAYPNPNNGIFNIQIVNPTGKKIKAIEVYNSVGVNVLTLSEINNTHSGLINIPVDLNEHKAGIYFIEIKESEKGILGSTKIVKY